MDFHLALPDQCRAQGILEQFHARGGSLALDGGHDRVALFGQLAQIGGGLAGDLVDNLLLTPSETPPVTKAI